MLKFSFNFGGMRIFVVSCCLRKKQRYRKSENDNIWAKQERTVRYTPKHVQRKPSIREKLLRERLVLAGSFCELKLGRAMTKENYITIFILWNPPSKLKKCLKYEEFYNCNSVDTSGTCLDIRSILVQGDGGVVVAAPGWRQPMQQINNMLLSELKPSGRTSLTPQIKQFTPTARYGVGQVRLWFSFFFKFSKDLKELNISPTMIMLRRWYKFECWDIQSVSSLKRVVNCSAWRSVLNRVVTRDRQTRVGFTCCELFYKVIYSVVSVNFSQFITNVGILCADIVLTNKAIAIAVRATTRSEFAKTLTITWFW